MRGGEKRGDGNGGRVGLKEGKRVEEREGRGGV